MQKTLILWDIDGTILHSTGAGMKALNHALQTVFGIAGSFEGIDFAGRTDPAIIRQIFLRFGIEHSPENVGRYVDGYVAALPAMLVANDARVLPGVAEILGHASEHPGVAQGLLTGNLRRGAQIKLGHHGLWDYFPVGAFADDSEIRNELGPHAHRRAKGHWGDDFPVERVWIVGDTPHDVACARAFGARALAVATGSSSASALATHGPDAVLENLAQPEAFWRAVLR
jgi:phosphoglycolate phosphatase